MVETASDDILAGADEKDIAFLVVGDPFGYAKCAKPSRCDASGRMLWRRLPIYTNRSFTELQHTATWFCEQENSKSLHTPSTMPPS